MYISQMCDFVGEPRWWGLHPSTDVMFYLLALARARTGSDARRDSASCLFHP